MIFRNHIKTNLFKILLGITVIAVFSQCNPTRHLEQNEILLHKNKVYYANEDPNDRRIAKRELKALIAQQPNSRLFGFLPIKWRLWIYNIANKGKENKLKWLMKNKFGEPPVILDSSKVEQATARMESFLENKGYFHAEVNNFIQTENKKGTVIYCVAQDDLYHFDSLTFPEPVNRETRIIEESKENSFIKPGDPYDVDVIKQERTRITRNLKNKGYYEFSKEYIYFEMDSSELTQKVDVEVKLSYPEGENKHQVYRINNIYVFPDHELKVDSIQIPYDTIREEGYTFIYKGSMPYKPSVLISNIFIEPGELYTIVDYERTLSRLSRMEVFKFANIRYKKTGPGNNDLNVFVYLSQTRKQAISIELETYAVGQDKSPTLTPYSLGLGLSYGYMRKNTFRLADILNFNQGFSVEPQLFFNDTVEAATGEKASRINTINFSTGLDLTIPKFIMPNIAHVSKFFNPKTKVHLDFGIVNRVDFYNLKTGGFAFGYDWHEYKEKRHLVFPVTISLVDVSNTKPAFEERLERFPFLRKSFEEQLIIGGTYTFIYDDKKKERMQNSFFFKGNYDMAGNSIYLANLITGGDKNADGNYDIFGRHFSQYIRLDGDGRFYQIFNNRNQMVYRVVAGVGIPYLNSDQFLPYIKQFYVGGSNGIRAWRVRQLGPGSFRDTTSAEKGLRFFDQTGDIRLEMNAEFRFDVIGRIEGALFADAGNIWLLNEDTARPGGKFSKDFLKEIALGSGFGIRIDYDFFVIRVDIAFKIYDPARQEWVWGNFGQSKGLRNKFILNLAVGYPF